MLLRCWKVWTFKLAGMDLCKIYPNIDNTNKNKNRGSVVNMVGQSRVGKKRVRKNLGNILICKGQFVDSSAEGQLMDQIGQMGPSASLRI